MGNLLLDKYFEQLDIKDDRKAAFSELKTGSGIAIGHHGEIIQGSVEHPLKGNRRFLVTLPWAGIQSKAKFVLLKNSSLKVEPFWKTKSCMAAALTLKYLDFKEFGGVLEVYSEAAPELGFGSSTSDVVASIRAVTSACKRVLTPSEISAIAVKAELACDPTMFEEQAVVFFQREGVVMEQLLNRLPSAFIVGFNASMSRRGLATLDIPLPEYGHKELEIFLLLLEDLRVAVRNRSVQLLGRVATASARINQRFLPKPNFDSLLEILNQTGACGLQVAHTGNIAGFIYDPKDGSLADRFSKVRHALFKLGIEDVWHFNT